MTASIETADICRIIGTVIENVAGIEFKEIVIEALQTDFGIHVNGGGAISLDELEGAFIDLFGESTSSLIMSLIYKEAAKMQNQKMYMQSWK